MEPTGWEPVDSFGSGAPVRGPLTALEAVLAEHGQRFRSPAGGRAVLVPARSLQGGAVPAVTLAGTGTDAAEVLFLDPPTGAEARSLLAALGDRAGSVRAALPEEADPAGLVPEAGRVSVTIPPSAPVDYRLFRLAGTQRATDRERLAAAPKLGESADVLDQRSKWFEARERGRP